jgi:hypothetical protein
MVTTRTKRIRGVSGPRRYSQRCAIPTYQTVVHPPRGDIGNGLTNLGGQSLERTGERTVRYAVEWDMAALHDVVARAAGNVQGYAKAGPVIVYIHPEDGV